jgi:hypothetical protein
LTGLLNFSYSYAIQKTHFPKMNSQRRIDSLAKNINLLLFHHFCNYLKSFYNSSNLEEIEDFISIIRKKHIVLYGTLFFQILNIFFHIRRTDSNVNVVSGGNSSSSSQLNKKKRSNEDNETDDTKRKRFSDDHQDTFEFSFASDEFSFNHQQQPLFKTTRNNLKIRVLSFKKKNDFYCFQFIRKK